MLNTSPKHVDTKLTPRAESLLTWCKIQTTQPQLGNFRSIPSIIFRSKSSHNFRNRILLKAPCRTRDSAETIVVFCCFWKYRLTKIIEVADHDEKAAAAAADPLHCQTTGICQGQAMDRKAAVSLVLFPTRETNCQILAIIINIQYLRGILLLSKIIKFFLIRRIYDNFACEPRIIKTTVAIFDKTLFVLIHNTPES